MTAIELISKDIPTLKTSDTGQAALDLMDTYRVSHLPVVNNIYFLGLISDNDIYNLNKLDEAIGNHKLSLFSPFIFSDQHFYEVIALMTKLKLTIIPVLQRDNKYIGAICAAPLVIGKMGFLEGRQATCYPSVESNLFGATYRNDLDVIVDGNFITSKGPGTAMVFALKLVELLKGKQISKDLASDLLI